MPSNKKEYAREYYLKNRTSTYDSSKNHCKCCNKTYKSNCLSRHLESTKHKLNQELFTLKNAPNLINNLENI